MLIALSLILLHFFVDLVQYLGGIFCLVLHCNLQDCLGNVGDVI